MPELPEVETTKRKLEPLLIGKRILNLEQRKILKLERRGKVILIYLSGNRILGFHQRMSGKLLVVPHDFIDKHIRFRFRLSSGKDLIFHDVRKFGVRWYGPTGKVLKDRYLSKLGPDPLKIDFKQFGKRLKAHQGMIKPLLLRQDVFAGIGNIVANEVLWKAKIHPRRKIEKSRESEIKNLYVALRFILKKSIRLGGTTMRDWLHPDRSEGRYYKKRFVYQRVGEKCKRCGGIIKRIKVGSRGTFICEKCQRLYRR
ncbi:MAG: DNA-formamidopyrimidine glycosylase [bacterium]|nr:DNA-formamidopyrimidine glycosylase [bacterium]